MKNHLSESVVVVLTIMLLTSCDGCSGGSSTPTSTNGNIRVGSAVSGKVAESLGVGIPGVTIALTGVSPATTVTDSNGNYGFNGLANGNYNITPTKAGYTCSPTTMSIAINDANVTGLNFVGYDTVGTVTLSSIAITPTSSSIKTGSNQQFIAIGTYSDNTIQIITPSVTWTSSDTSKATISNTGLASAVATGSATIKATSGSISGTATLTITASSRTYTTNFSATENPISEGGNWINGGTTGLDWGNVRTATNLVYGTATTVKYSDPTAILTGTWPADQQVTATVHSINQNASYYQEVELRLRTSISAHSITGYEIIFRCLQTSAAYEGVVRWNGPLGNFTSLSNHTGSQYGVTEGDVVKATIIGNTINVYKNGTLIDTVTDNTYSSGNPGIGFNYGTGNGTTDYGFTSFTAE